MSPKLPGQTDQEVKRLKVEQAVVRLVEALAELEGTPYFRASVTSGTGGTYDLVVEKRTKIVKPPAIKNAAIGP